MTDDAHDPNDLPVAEGWLPPGWWPLAIGTTVDEFPVAPPDRDGLRGGHHVALAWVIDPAATRILLVEHHRQGWSCPGGHVEPGEPLLAAARRELAEETGLTLDPISPNPVTLARSVGCPRRPGADVEHWSAGFLFVVDPAADVETEPGQPARWWPLDVLPTPRPADLDVVADRLCGIDVG